VGTLEDNAPEMEYEAPDLDVLLDEEPHRYENVTRRNVFTTRGRCGPGDTVMLPTEEAEKYFGQLKPCQT
jgi:hypothetical protein